MAGNYGSFNRRALPALLTTGDRATINFGSLSGSTMATMDYWRTPEPLEIVGIYMIVTTAVVASATLVDGVYTLYKMATAESDSNAAAVPLVAPEGASTAYAKMTIKAIVTPGYVAGKVFRRLFNPIIWLPGEQFKIYCTTALAASGSGVVEFGLLVDFHPEIGANCTKLVEFTS